MKHILVAAIAVALTGCVVAPVEHGRRGQVYVEPQLEYYWEPTVQLWYFERSGRRHWQPREWNHPRHGRGHDRHRQHKDHKRGR